ncbi:bifunctional heptose 7-phosphate kinase/heptose 1-phosphate adenyltransferase [Adhaeribacter radiodurans]|uniref:D-glycero-beta-D-manno-heptose-7-phosphate kinase n=1 Tax=Adhaeribacter radiodurans TaxID=2745197 RepID=A0A7L7L925_9BACT|nr:bifunctional ADP-heptose synthase [Adhaeribacter radiodurans]QMU28899.1 D-glycero-beta-D-manno-heptose-7-phosphate kinase [Adhaeribacter radiodurans]
MTTFNSLEAIFDSFNQLTVLVVGDVMIDSYLWGKSSRLSPEAPVPIVNVVRKEKRLGGAANVALNVQALGATPLLCAVIGEDFVGAELLRLMEEQQLPTDGIIKSPDRITTVKERILAGGQQLLRIDAEMEAELLEHESAHLVQQYSKLLPLADVVIFEDYDKGVLNEGNIAAMIELARQHDIPTVVDPKKKNFLSYVGCTLFKPNLKELKEGLKIDFADSNHVAFEQAAFTLQQKLNTPTILITLSERGVFYLSGPHKKYIAAHLRTISDVSGAGDTVISIAALCLALDLPIAFVAGLSNLGGGLVCEQVGVVPIDKVNLLVEAQRTNTFQLVKITPVIKI